MMMRGFCLALAAALVAGGAPKPAQAMIDMVSGARGVAKSAALDDCNARAKSALTAVLTNTYEAGAGTGQWAASGPADASGNASSGAAIHCFPVGKGYVVTLTCAVQLPNSAESAHDLCGRLQTAFGSQQNGGIAWR